jgi:acetoacetyl-CoA synthetase
VASGAAIVALDERGAGEEIGWEQLRGQVGALAAALAELGVGPGDRVAAYLPNIPEAIVAMLAVTSLGAIWAACAPDFGTQSVVDRLAQVEPTVLIAVDGYRFGGRDHDRAGTVRALEAAMPSLRATILVRGRRDRALAFEDLVAPAREPEFEQVDFDHPLWILFSSGTTGVPKGIVQGHGGILLEHLKALGLCLDLRGDDRYFFHSSTSWMAWNYLVGGLIHGATIVSYDGSPAHPGADALWAVAARTRASVVGLGSAYVTGCTRSGAVPEGDGRDLGALRTLIPTGSPLPPRGWRWLDEQFAGRVRIDSICGGTDVCTAFFGGSPLLDVRAGEISCRWLGVKAEAWSEDGRPVVDEVGEFVVTAPMPSMPIGFWDDADGSRYRAAYFERFPGVWRQGDWITITSRGGVVVSGRSDATLNRGGVRMGSAEIYAVVERLDEIADSLVVGVEEPDGGYYMPLFVVPREGEEVDGALRDALVAAIRSDLSPRHVPDEIVVAPAIPRTLTGKKLEVPVKRVLQGVPVAAAASLGAVDRPDVLDWYARFAAGRRVQN